MSVIGGVLRVTDTDFNCFGVTTVTDAVTDTDLQIFELDM